MRKKMKQKNRNPRRPSHRPAAADRSCNASKPFDPNGDKGAGDREPCVHFGSVGLPSVIRWSRVVAMACQDCRGEPLKRINMEKGQQAGSKDSPGLHSIWVCLDCSRSFCGAITGGSEPRGHARRHARMEHHSLAVRSDNPLACWCFSCNSLVPIELPERTMDVNDVSVSGNPEQEKEIRNDGEHLGSEMKKGYLVGGLVNLGNTCFFNSVLQNLLSINMLREYLMSMDGPLEPLTMELRKLFIETNASEDVRGVLNPEALFECICANAPQFKGYQQQDSHELLRCLLDGLHTEEINRSKLLASYDERDKSDELALNSTANLVDVLFGGKLSSTVSCVECGHTSVVYEPFLDLSLPVPLKQLPVKRIPSTMLKRKKVCSREGSRGQKTPEKGAAKKSNGLESHKTESFSSHSDCNETVALAAEENFAVVDHIGSTVILDGADSVYQKCEVTIAQYSESGQIVQSESNVQCSVDAEIKIDPKEVVATSDSCGVSSCRDEAGSSCVQDSGVPLFSCKEVGIHVEKTNEITSCSQILENVVVTNDLVNESSMRTASVAGCEPAEVDFSGFGDLLNEPEITSNLKAGTAVVEEMDMSLWIGNSSRTNQDKASTNSPVSIDSCLALFTKPELLSDDHAWFCESCSEISPHETLRHRKMARLDHSKMLKSQLDGDEVKSTKDSPSIEVDCQDSSGFEVIAQSKMTVTAPKNFGTHMDIRNNSNTDLEGSMIPPSLIGGSVYNTCEYGQAEYEKSLESSHHIMDDGACFAGVLHKDEEFADSDTSQYLSCPSNHGKALSRGSSGNQDSDSCSVNEANCVGYDFQAQAGASSSAPGQTETTSQRSCENDNFSEVNQLDENGYQEEKEGIQLLGEVHLADNGGGKKKEPRCRKVKRDATKRVLIYKVPPILTIHLKRFSQDGHGRLNKLSGHVSFQETLDLRPYMEPRSEEENSHYRLIGVVEHLGSMTRGHYVAYMRGEKSKGKVEKGNGTSWFYASDTHVREVPLSEVLQREAYILFYERV